MKYIFKADGKCVASCNYEPNIKDLASRGEVAVESENTYDIGKIELVNSVIAEIVEPVHTLTQEEIIAGYISTVQKHLDDTAKTRGYDGIVSLCSYKGSTDPIFNAESTAGVAWRDSVWRTCYAIRDSVLAGTRGLPTDIISELPQFTWGN